MTLVLREFGRHEQMELPIHQQLSVMRKKLRKKKESPRRYGQSAGTNLHIHLGGSTP
jgi:hypothetical protein